MYSMHYTECFQIVQWSTTSCLTSNTAFLFASNYGCSLCQRFPAMCSRIFPIIVEDFGGKSSLSAIDTLYTTNCSLEFLNSFSFSLSSEILCSECDNITTNCATETMLPLSITKVYTQKDKSHWPVLALTK